MKSRAESHTFLDWLKTQVEYGQGQSLRWESMQLVLAQDSHPAKLAGSPCWCNWDTPRSAPRGRSDTSPGVTSQPAPCQACLGLLSGLLQAEQGAAVPQLCQSILQLLRRSEQKVLLSRIHDSSSPPLTHPRRKSESRSPPGLGDSSPARDSSRARVRPHPPARTPLARSPPPLLTSHSGAAPAAAAPAARGRIGPRGLFAPSPPVLAEALGLGDEGTERILLKAVRILEGEALAVLPLGEHELHGARTARGRLPARGAGAWAAGRGLRGSPGPEGRRAGAAGGRGAQGGRAGRGSRACDGDGTGPRPTAGCEGESRPGSDTRGPDRALGGRGLWAAAAPPPPSADLNFRPRRPSPLPPSRSRERAGYGRV